MPSWPVRLLKALTWWLTWGLSFLVAQLLGVVVNALAVSVNFLGTATEAHVDTSAPNFVIDHIVDLLPIAGLLPYPLVITFGVLWFVGPRVSSKSFRVLRYVMFLWYAPLMVLFWGTELLFPLWLIVSLLFAWRIRLPRYRLRGTPVISSAVAADRQADSSTR